MIRILALSLALSSCADETISGYLDRTTVWRLVELDDVAFATRAIITFPAEGDVAGQAPCNSYRATQTVPYPWFEIGPVVATRMACPDLAAETAFFEALQAMTLAEVQGEVLLLTNMDGREMVFRAD